MFFRFYIVLLFNYNLNLTFCFRKMSETVKTEFVFVQEECMKEELIKEEDPLKLEKGKN